MEKKNLLQSITFGHRVAEDETDALSTYFVETDSWRRLFGGEIDVVYGPKGSGKSALYSLLNSKGGELFDRGVILVAGENPKGAPAFRDIATDPPAEEREFIGLWKLYFASLLHSALSEYGVANSSSKILEESLRREGLVKGRVSLAALLRAVMDYARRALNPQAVEAGIKLNPTTGVAEGFTGKIVFSESSRGVDAAVQSVDQLLALADDALRTAKCEAWIILDRLDVAFADHPDLETNALRALFRVYLDLSAFSKISLKIFLRTDIWTRITSQGFREASHITRHLTIDWNRPSLLNLVVRRALYNPALRKAYDVTDDLAQQPFANQEAFFYRMCPDKVDEGSKKSTTFDWLLSRTRDGTNLNAPRELIHFLNSLRESQIRMIEFGEPEPAGETLFSRSAFKEALPAVSRVRLEQTLYAEHPSQKDRLERLKGAKTLHTPETLAEIWSVSTHDAATRASELASIGFFETRGTRLEPEFWVPFLYRDSLELVQGTAD